MIRTFLLCISMWVASYYANAQHPVIDFVYSYGGDRADGGGKAFHFTKDGYILYGSGTTSHTNDLTCNTFDTTHPAGRPEVGWLLKLDKAGNEIFTRCYSHVFFSDLMTTRDSGCIGGSNSTYCKDTLHTGKDLSLQKLDKDGNIQWMHCYGGPVCNMESIDTTSDGGYIFLAESNYAGGDIDVHYGSSPFLADCFLVKVDSVGTIQWKRVLGGSDDDRPSKVKQIAPGKYLTIINSLSTDSMLTGLPIYYDNSSGNNDWYCVFDSVGNIIQQAVMPWWGAKVMSDVVTTKDGGYMMCGLACRLPQDVVLNKTNHNCTTQDSTNGDFAIFKLDSAFQIQWCWTEGGEYLDYLRTITAMSDTTFLAVGYSTSPDYNASSLCLVHPNSNQDEGWVFCIDIHGTILWRKCFSGSLYNVLDNCLYDATTGNIFLSGGGYSIDGDVTGVPNYGAADEWLVKMEVWHTGIKEIEETKVVIYPNPTSGKIWIEMRNEIEGALSISNSLGQIVYTGKLNRGSTSINVELPSGILFYRAELENGQVETGKVVVLR